MEHLPIKQKIIIMLAVMSGMFLAALDQTIVSTALPKILGEFNALKELSWVVTAYLLTSTIAVPIAGKLSDLYGRRRLLLIGIIVFVAASLLCGAAQNIEQLIAYRALQGIGGGILFANAFAIIGDLFSLRERGKWQGIIGAIFGLSSLVGPLLGGFFSDNATLAGITTSWRWAFLINVPVGLIAFGMIARFLPSHKAPHKISIDFLGAGVLSAALAALILATSLGGTPGWAWNSPQIIGLLIGAVATGALFVWVESKAKDPIIPLHLFRKPIYALVCVLMLLFGMGFFGAIIFTPTFAQQILHFSATNSGIILLPMVVALTIGSIVIGQVVNKTGKYKLLTLSGLAIAAIGIYTLSTLGVSSTYWDLAWRMVLTGIGMGMAMPILNLVAQNAAQPKDLGVASSTALLARSIGGTVGLAIMGGVMNNVLSQKITNIQQEPFVQMATAQGQGGLFENFDINSLQTFLSSQVQTSIITQLQQLPESMQQQGLAMLSSFVQLLQGALAASITQVFLVSAVVMAVAFVIALFIKEEPLRQHDAHVPDVG